MGKISSLRSKANDIRQQFNITSVQYATLQPDVQDLTASHRKLQDDLNTIERTRSNALQETRENRMTLKNLADKYSTATTQFRDLEAIDIDSLTGMIRKIDTTLRELSSKTKALQQRLSALPSRKASYEDAKMRLGTEKGNLDRFLMQFGDENTIKERIDAIDRETSTIAADLDRLSGQQRIIKLAADQLEKTKANTCPVCSQDIDNMKLVTDLRSKISLDVASKIKTLEDREKTLKANRKKHEEAQQEQIRVVRNIADLDRKLKAAADSLQTLVERNLAEVDLEALASAWEKELLNTSNEESRLRSERAQIEETISKREQVLKEIADTQKQLQWATGSTVEGSVLLEKVAEKLSSMETDMQRYARTSDIDESRHELMHLSDTLTYLRDEENTATAERELPVLSKQIEDLEARKTTLQLLEGSLNSIRKLTTEYAKEASLTQLKRLEEQINQYYSAIMGHPHFTRLKIDIEKEDPLIYSIRAASSTEETYIPTRFSTAQLNVAALAIFMSNSTQLAGELPIMILDDPTQNMDSAHKETLAKLVSRLSSQYQIIISTEDAETRQFIQNNCSNFRAYEFTDWNTNGPEIKGPS